MSKFKVFSKSILIPLIAGALVGIITSGSNSYNNLNQPSFAPPSVLFPIVWTILYILMGISYGIINYKSLNDDRSKILYYAQLIVNLIWPILFFTLEQRFLAFVWIIILDVLIIMMIVEFYKKDKTAGLIQIPYLLWCLFATYLNYSVYMLNK